MDRANCLHDWYLLGIIKGNPSGIRVYECHWCWARKEVGRGARAGLYWPEDLQRENLKGEVEVENRGAS